MSRLLVAGLVVTIVVLGFNYYTSIIKNAETSRELSQIRLELHRVTSGQSETLKKWKWCQADVAAAHDIGKNRNGEVKKKDQMIADLTKQINVSRKLENKLKEEIEKLNARLSAANAEAKVCQPLRRYG